MRNMMFCEHANENPIICGCPEDCACLKGACEFKAKWERIPIKTGMTIKESHTKCLMTLNEYQKAADKFVITRDLTFRLLKLAEEVGETVQVYTKRLAPLEAEQEMLGELGDVLFQIAGLATHYGWSLEDVAEYNIKKLKYREEMNGSSK